MRSSGMQMAASPRGSFQFNSPRDLSLLFCQPQVLFLSRNLVGVLHNWSEYLLQKTTRRTQTKCTSSKIANAESTGIHDPIFGRHTLINNDLCITPLTFRPLSQILNQCTIWKLLVDGKINQKLYSGSKANYKHEFPCDPKEFRFPGATVSYLS